MVIEITKEIDVVRIGIDRYSLKTGLNLKSVMDVSTRVIKEPRGFIRIIQFVLAILAFSTTAGFSTNCEFLVTCPGSEELVVHYEVEYPFSPPELLVPEKSCSEGEPKSQFPLPYTYSTAAEFFVATGVLSFLYIIFIMAVYIFGHQRYAEDSKLPAIDLGISAVLAVFWLAGSSAWSQGVIDLKYYLHPDKVFMMLHICREAENECKITEDGTYGVLNASLILGFTNFVVWTFGLWFVYKETSFHTSDVTTDPNLPQQQVPKGIGRV